MGLGEAFEAGRFAVTAELGPPRGADPDAVYEKAELLRDWVDAVNLTDNQGAMVRMSSLAAAVLAMRAGVEPIMQLTVRDRNRMALQADLLGAGALGIPNVLLLSGDHPVAGDDQSAIGVFDVDSVQLVWAARTMRDHKRLISGRRVKVPPVFRIGCVENPFAPPVEFRAARLAKKAAAGAEFVQTQYVFDVPLFERWMSGVREHGVQERCKVLAGVGPIRSPRMLEHLRTGVAGVHVPDDVVARFAGVPANRFEETGLELCAETIARLREIPGVAGAHVMAFGNERAVPTVLEQAGLTRITGTRITGKTELNESTAPMEEVAHRAG